MEVIEKMTISKSVQVLVGGQKIELFPKQAVVFMCLLYKSFENTVGKGEIACKKQFLFFPQCFLPLR